MFNYDEAAIYLALALQQDPTNTAVAETAILSQIARGHPEKAVPIAVQQRERGYDSQVVTLVILGSLAKNGDYAGAIAELDDGHTAGPLVDDLFRAWSLVGQGQMSEALTVFDGLSEQPGLRTFGLYHKALALASVGDFEGADAIFSGKEGGPLQATRRGVIAHAEILSQLERNAAAVELIERVVGGAIDPELEVLRQSLIAGGAVPFDVIRDPADGIAEVFATVAGVLNAETGALDALTFTRLAEFLRPDYVDAILMSAGILERQDQHELATKTYNRISSEDPSYLTAELGRVDALVASDRIDAAIEALQQLAKARPKVAVVWSTLGDILRRQERFSEAAAAYDRAIADLPTEQPGQWVVYYTRGICHEREKDWAAAEADFRKALELSPNQPQVLNYMGYSFLEMNTNLDEALSMIERAVAAKPEDGYIVDSLGWALYRMGRYEEAVARMEKAVELMPVDSIVNDHLGDVYWAVGRQREAEFQWKRALSFEPESEEDATRIRRKLEVGLDAVLAEEGAEPLAVSKNGN
ncbi:MAG: tetratricopeptide repeat protein [Rhodobacteraceae bacterium]|nr:tetratricopeptide repeat protein [Paracoccaceae bacterium]MCC0045806.1 tetratricopeptide repeat protein [Defluviimonas sp.]MCB2122612.1 tetratricopeptide repeat protein [Paracoccaceae bacterium]MCB2143022.1 tetratricopeptide repeat protein [Paracoccaceae bacterium]MCB2151797.1 tetratricopeptide repeat protein [Paracoccaceae bacterium]